MADPNLKFTITVPSVAFTFDKKLLRRIVAQAGREVVLTARGLIGRMAGGRKYGAHIASSPGAPPMSLTGALARSLKVTTRGDTATIIDSAFYSVMLEGGARGGGGKKGTRNRRGKPATERVLLPRPFLSTAATEEMPRLESRILAAVSRGIDLKTLKRQS